jgi:hypothetical protein
MKESELLSFAITCLKQSGLVWWRVANGPVKHGGVLKKSPIKGFPDLAGVMPNGRFFAIELKSADGKLSSEQIEWITKLNHTGGMAVILRTKDEVREFVIGASQMKTRLAD